MGWNTESIGGEVKNTSEQSAISILLSLDHRYSSFHRRAFLPGARHDKMAAHLY